MEKIEVTLDLWQSQGTVAMLTVTDGHSGRKARCWLSCRLKPNGRAEATISVLGKDERTDSSKSAWLPWHDNLDKPKGGIGNEV